MCWSKDWNGKGYSAFSKFCGAPISLQHIYKDIGVDYFCIQVCALPVYVHSLHFIVSARLLQHALKSKNCGLKCHCCWSVVCISALSLGFGDLKSQGRALELAPGDAGFDLGITSFNPMKDAKS